MDTVIKKCEDRLSNMEFDIKILQEDMSKITVLMVDFTKTVRKYVKT